MIFVENLILKNTKRSIKDRTPVYIPSKIIEIKITQYCILYLY